MMAEDEEGGADAGEGASFRTEPGGRSQIKTFTEDQKSEAKHLILPPLLWKQLIKPS